MLVTIGLKGLMVFYIFCVGQLILKSHICIKAMFINGCPDFQRINSQGFHVTEYNGYQRYALAHM